MGNWDILSDIKVPSVGDVVGAGKSAYHTGASLVDDASESIADTGEDLWDSRDDIYSSAVDLAHDGYGYGERAYSEASSVASDAGDGLSDLYNTSTHWHFEGRHARNQLPKDVSELPLEEGVTNDYGWTRQPDWMAKYHQDPDYPNREVKFVNDNGSESIRYQNGDGSLGDEVTKTEYMGSYNYVNPGVWEGDLEDDGVEGAAEFGARAVGHFFTDVVPYYLGGQVRGDG